MGLVDRLRETANRSASHALRRRLRRTYHFIRGALVWPPPLWQRYVDPGIAAQIRRWRERGESPEVTVLVVTYNRLAMLRECIHSMLEKTTGVDFEILVWDNASTDGTAEFLDGIAAAHSVMRIIHSPENIGLNAVAKGMTEAHGFYVLECDDDVIEFPDDWLGRMLKAFKRVPRTGYLATNVLRNEKTDGARAVPPDMPVTDYGDGVVIEEGAVGGWCAMTSLAVLARIGNFRSKVGRIFLLEDGDFAGRCIGAGLSIGVVRDVVVYHACGPILNEEFGCLDTMMTKYSDSPEFAAHLDRAKQTAGGGE